MRKSNDQPLKEILKYFVNSPKIKPKLHQAKIVSSWADLMGDSISNYTRDIKLRKNTLFITINSAPLRQELSYAKEKIRKMLNEELKEEYIHEVVIR